jgi:hypothetical protein
LVIRTRLDVQIATRTRKPWAVHGKAKVKPLKILKFMAHARGIVCSAFAAKQQSFRTFRGPSETIALGLAAPTRQDDVAISPAAP